MSLTIPFTHRALSVKIKYTRSWQKNLEKIRQQEEEVIRQQAEKIRQNEEDMRQKAEDMRLREEAIRRQELEILQQKAIEEKRLKGIKMRLAAIKMLQRAQQEMLPFKHSGTLGDIIYSIPIMRAIAKGRAVKLYLHLNQPSCAGNNHPLKGIMLDEGCLQMLKPLLESQDITVMQYDKEDVINLDLFRSMPEIDLKMGNIPRYFQFALPVEYDLSDPWLKLPKNPKYRDTIVITRTLRYNNPDINYEFINDYGNVIFVGLPEEYEKLNLKNVQFHPINDFLEAATIINSCKFFIGNQTFLFALAEALKIPRILECCMLCPNVIPEGGRAYNVCFQEAFEYAFSILNEK